jgi:predicted DNA-binding transcriptional regulator YafY
VRVLAILRILLLHRRLTVHDLARRFWVRRKTIYRDLRVLGGIGYSITGVDDEYAGRISGRPRLVAATPASHVAGAGFGDPRTGGGELPRQAENSARRKVRDEV